MWFRPIQVQAEHNCLLFINNKLHYWLSSSSSSPPEVYPLFTMPPSTPLGKSLLSPPRKTCTLAFTQSRFQYISTTCWMFQLSSKSGRLLKANIETNFSPQQQGWQGGGYLWWHDCSLADSQCLVHCCKGEQEYHIGHPWPFQLLEYQMWWREAVLPPPLYTPLHVYSSGNRNAHDNTSNKAPWSP